MKQIEIPIRYVCECADTLRPLEGSVTKNMTGIGNDNFTWHSKNSSPSFSLFKRPLFAGWYMVEIKIVANKEYLDASLVFDYSTNRSRGTTHSLLLISQKKTKRVIYVAPSVEGIRFSPAEQKIVFTVESLRFVKLTQRLALKLMQKKLRTYEPDINYSSTLQLWRHYSLLFRKQQKSEADYPIWIEKREPLIIKQELHVNNNTRFTIFLDTSGEKDFNKYINTLVSIKNQTYHNWEAVIIHKNCLSDSDSRRIKALLNSNELNNLTLITKTEDQKIALSELVGYINNPYCFFLTSDTVLSKHALSAYARNIENHDSPTILYSDDDIINEKGVRSNPRFKPDWNPDLLLSQNYIGECLVIHTTLLKKATDIAVDSEGSWIYSILIHQLFKKINIKHISLILNHTKKKSTTNSGKKNKLQLLALKSYLSKFHAQASYGKAEGLFRVKWSIEKEHPLVSIIIPTRDGMKILQRAIDSILSTTQYSNYEILVVDNQSREKSTLQYLHKIQNNDKIRVIQYDEPFNYSGLNNYAAKKAKGSILALLNNDIEIISPEWLTEMVSHAMRPDIGCVGAMLYYPDNRIQHAGVIIGLGGCAGHSHKFFNRGDNGYTDRLLCVQNYSAVTAACLVVEKNIFHEVDGLNETELVVAFNDVDFCLKVQALGYRNLWTPWAELYHYESISRGQDNTRKKRKRLTSEVNYMRDTWKTARATDPNYSKFLTKIREDFSFGL